MLSKDHRVKESKKENERLNKIIAHRVLKFEIKDEMLKKLNT